MNAWTNRARYDESSRKNVTLEAKLEEGAPRNNPDLVLMKHAKFFMIREGHRAVQTPVIPFQVFTPFSAATELDAYVLL